ncbi:fatty acid desaturase family protein [Cystobacter fuscus]|uniref:fatty acid desaturase family protein n=1 Tax=Cystobacter fuscus TaxID=43 RepID=UPI002B2F5F5D|nr:fatty acid desaturase [Cystobacter fuscus]
MSRATADFEPASVDLEGLLADIRALRAELDASVSEADYSHLRRIERWGRTAAVIGLATCWLMPNPLSAAALGLGRSSRWMLMHHMGHRCYDRVPGIPVERTSKEFAKGKRRFLDWFDWMLPEAWVFEHNVLHHSHTGEDGDPDVHERNSEGFMRGTGLPLALRYVRIVLLASTWRASYYAPTTLASLRRKRRPDGPLTREEWREVLLRGYAPYIAWNFVLLPALFLPLGTWAAFSALCNSLMAEILSNLHTFMVGGPNHTGEDLYRFDSAPEGKGARYVQQVIGTANYRTGGDLNDFLHLWLNYQIEHHIFPDLSMLQYQRVQPKVRALCQKYGIPYVQESVWTRLRKMVDVAVGKKSMRRLASRAAARAPV